jgi:hypothetical protein
VLILEIRYPGTVEATVTYAPSSQTSDDGKTVQVLDIQYEVKLVGDEVSAHSCSCSCVISFFLYQSDR